MKLFQVNKENIFAFKSLHETISLVQSQTLTEEQFTREYAEVFEGVSLLSGALRLVIDSAIPPVQLRRIPLAVKDKLKDELDRIVKLNVITSVDNPIDWISVTVVAIRKDGNIRRGFDSKPLNKALKLKSMIFCPIQLFLMPRMVIGMLNWINRARMLPRLVHLGSAIGG
ncbi:Hypothetical predicted protein [Paramuricea clavata]|uniref:Uncharacterized protein n=1 Tax=Paramuricea clavata TaxID=317549 RepID=A0A6S7KB69_PARCT|nr:Hypothetical predicted protein [Paramuricea clavata]